MPDAHEDPIQSVAPATLPAPGNDTATANTTPGSDRPGARFGPYRLLRPLGQGGMGSVWLAMRDDGSFERKVALKILQRELAGSEWRERFLRERQIHAELQHPNIAAMFDGGVGEDGRPFFVMEYVEGRPITQFCDEEHLGVRERVRLFQQVLAAVAHAHQQLVVHRDIKPGNILVTEGRMVKLLDFGIASLLESGDGEVAADRAMTLRYAAPEQVRGEPPSMATDVYALGVTLFEVLTGRLPYDEAAPLEQAILGHAPLPATAVLARSGVTTALAAARFTYESEIDLSALRRSLAGDLESILAKALRKNPAQRYPWAEAFAADLSNHLAQRPVHAHPPSLHYVAGKWLRRHAASAAMAFIGVAILLTALAMLHVQQRQAGGEAIRAAMVMTQMATALDESGRSRDALAGWREAAELLRSGGVRPGELARALVNLAMAELDSGDPDAAADHADEAARLAAADADANADTRGRIDQLHVRIATARGQRSDNPPSP